MQAETAERGCTSSYNREAQEYLDLLFLLWLARPGLPGSRPFFFDSECNIGRLRYELGSREPPDRPELGDGPRLVEVVLKQDHPFSA